MSLEAERKTKIISINYVCSAATDVGKHRENNEDIFVFDPKNGFFMVVDGMGGHDKGEVAAKVAAETIQTGIRKIENSSEIRLRDSIILANNSIFEYAQQNQSNMGCVLTALLIENDKAIIGHIGDTRLYKIHNGKINKLTTDHSIVGILEEEGNLSESRLLEHPQRNEVIRCVGIEKKTFEEEDFVDILQTDFENDSAFLLCSDGLSDLLKTSQILEIIEENADSPENIVKNLIAKANDLGGKDNITVIFIGGKDFACAVSTLSNKQIISYKQRLNSFFTNRWIFLHYGILAGGTIMYFVFNYFFDMKISEFLRQ